MKRLYCLLLTLLLAAPAIQADNITDGDIVILYDNDVHGRMYGYPKMAALKDEMLRTTPNVLLVSMGDFSQGGPLCSISHGEYAVSVMNRVGYDYVTLGNHEFDYGLDQLDKLTSSLTARTLVCNYTDLRTNSNVYAPFAIRKLGGKSIGFIGVVAPLTKNSDSPQSFIDADGNDIYSFGRPDFYGVIQRTVDEVRRHGADMVILLGHLGDNPFFIETSEEAIQLTNGIDVVLDGHAHSVIEGRHLNNKDGQDVLLSSTGSHFQNIGRLVIRKDGSMSTELISVPSYKNERQDICQLIDSMQSTLNNLPTIAKTDFDLVGFDMSHGTYDRAMQTNLGSLCADAFRIMTGATIGWINAGGIRGSITAGDITFKDLLSVLPFENQVCVSEFTGQQIADALEFGIYRAPADNGSYPQVSGLKFDIDLNVTSAIMTDEIGRLHSVEDPRRISNIRYLNTTTGKYEPLEMDRYYTIASIDYMLKNYGCYGILKNGTMIQDDQMIDTQIIEEFLTKHLNGVISPEYSNKVQDMK